MTDEEMRAFIEEMAEERRREQAAAASAQALREIEEAWPDTPLTPDQELMRTLKLGRRVISFQATNGNWMELETIARAKGVKTSILLRRMLERYLLENAEVQVSHAP